jgi:hypothetical protein
MTHSDDSPILVTAAVNGRRLTLDPIVPLVPLDAQPRRVESSMPAGFRVMWLDGGDAIYQFSLTAGAGVGSKYLVLTLRIRDGDIIAEEVIDVEDLTRRWISKILDQPTPEGEPDVDSNG